MHFKKLSRYCQMFLRHRQDPDIGFVHLLPPLSEVATKPSPRPEGIVSGQLDGVEP